MHTAKFIQSHTSDTSLLEAGGYKKRAHFDKEVSESSLC